jgi:endoglucanase
MRTLLLLAVLLLSQFVRAESGFVHAAGKQLVDGRGKPLMLRGTSLGNWMEPEGYMFLFKNGPQSPREIEEYFNELIGPKQAAAFWREYRDAYITKADIDLLAKTGVNSVRVPIHYKFFTAGNDEGFALLDRVIGWAKADGIYVVIDMHCAPGGQTGTNIDDSWGYPWLFETPEDQEQLIAVWKRIAEHYKDETTVLGYDLLNEPIPQFPALQKYNDRLEPLYKRVAAGIRSVDTHHVLILGGARWDTNFKVFGPPFDGNSMYTFHKYWMPPTQDAIREYVDFRDRYNVPIWLGESGENTDEWVSEFRALLEKNGMGWAFWPYKKMGKSSAFVSFAKPEHWDAIVAYAAERKGTGNAEKQIAERPSIEDARAAMASLLENLRVAKCHVNDGYLRALGLSVPPAQ